MFSNRISDLAILTSACYRAVVFVCFSPCGLVLYFGLFSALRVLCVIVSGEVGCAYLYRRLV